MKPEPVVFTSSSTPPSHTIEVENLTRVFGQSDAVNNLSFVVRPGTVFGFFGRNGAGKTTTIRCLLNLLKPTAGTVRIFGLSPTLNEVEVKRRLAYVPDTTAFFPWMTVRQTLDYFASFRDRWDDSIEGQLLEKFGIDPGKRASALSKGQTMMLALIAAICPSPELLILDEPTSGLDPIIRREFLEAVIGAYQDAAPADRTIFLSTHLISEVQGLVDDFVIIDRGRAVLSASADDARNRFRRIRARFASTPPRITIPGVVETRIVGRTLEVVVSGSVEPVTNILRAHSPQELGVEALDLESIFVALLRKPEDVE